MRQKPQRIMSMSKRSDVNKIICIDGDCETSGVERSQLKKETALLFAKSEFVPGVVSLDTYFEKNKQLSTERSFFCAFRHESVLAVLLARVVFETADLDYIICDVDFRGQGFAHELLNEFVRFCRQNTVTKILLEVSVKNTVALAFYKGHGFSEIAVRRAYYANGDDAAILEKLL